MSNEKRMGDAAGEKPGNTRRKRASGIAESYRQGTKDSCWRSEPVVGAEISGAKKSK